MTVRERSRWIISLAGAILMMIALVLLATVGFSSVRLPLLIPWLIALCLAGLAGYSAHLAFTQRRTYQQVVVSSAAREAIARDRLQIAADLHDVVSHGLGAITLRARAGRAQISTDPLAADAVLTDIARLSRSATADLRAVLTVLRDPDGEAPMRPALGLADFPDLINNAQARGLKVTTDFTDINNAKLTAGLELTIAQIVREGLDNTLRHAGPTHVRVALGVVNNHVIVAIDDDGPVTGWQPTKGSGHGLQLLRERVAAMGGELTSRSHGYGHSLRAALPCEGS